MGPSPSQPIAWGARVEPAFRTRVRAIAARLGINPDWLMACMAFETGRTFSPTIRNAAGSGAIGLIQFMPSTASALGTSVEALADLSATSQLVYVEKYFKPSRGRMRSLEDVYMAILWPGGIGKADEFRLFSQHDTKHPKRYLQNRGLDWNEDGYITKAEACAGPARELRLGLMGENPA